MSTGAEHARAALDAWLGGDPAAMLVGESVGRFGGNGGSTRGLLASHGPGRVVDTPIGDRSALGLALGLALAGRAVCVELSGSRSLLAAAEILGDAGRMASTEFRPSLVIRVPLGGEAGPVVDAPVGALLATLPSVPVCVATASTAGALLQRTLGRGVHVVLEPRAELARHASPRDADPGRLAVLREGSHVTLAAVGSGVAAALEAADALAHDGVDAEVLDLVALSPVDPALGEHVRRTGRLIAVHPGDAGLSRPMLAPALDAAFLYLESPPGDCPPQPTAVADAARRCVHY